MSEIFLKDDIGSLLDNRFIVVIGDSIQRGVYKDLVLLLQRNRYLTESQLRAKGEMSFSGDKLIEGGQLGEMTNGVKYREVRQYQTDYHLVRFYFVTRCYNSYIESILADLSDDPLPDVVMMNSCLWDISRYGNSGVAQYKLNIKHLFKRFREMLPPSCLIIWNATMPISKKARGGFLIPAVEFMNSTLRLDILEANFFVHKLAVANGFNVLDLHYFLRHQLQRRAGDGVHWDMTAHRRITNLILTHIAQAWGEKPPQHTRQLLYRNEMQAAVNNNAPQTNLNSRPTLLSSLNFNFCHNQSNNISSQAGRRVSVGGPGNQQFNREAMRQSNFIQKYGGPIRSSNYDTPPEYQQVTPEFNQGQFASQGQFCEFVPDNVGQLPLSRGQFSWEPYRQKEFEPSQHARLYSDRADPYNSRNKRKEWGGRERGGYN